MWVVGFRFYNDGEGLDGGDDEMNKKREIKRVILGKAFGRPGVARKAENGRYEWIVIIYKELMK